MASLNLPVHSYQNRGRPSSTARLVNCYAELMPPGGKTPVLLTRSPGVKAWSTVGSDSIEGMYAKRINFASGALTRLYVVSGRELYSVDSAKTATLIGDVGTPTRIDFAHNTDSLVVVNEPKAYYYDGATFAEITDPDFTSRGAGDVEFMENFLLFREPNSNRMFGADLGSATSYDALNFVNADSNPDDLVGMIDDQRQIVAFGTETTELFENTGAAGFPFERIINGTMQVGLADADLVARTFDVVYFVADDLTVRQLQGNNPVKVSTHYIEQLLEDFTISSGKGFSYGLEGHFFVGFSFLEGTIVYDAITGEWHERESFNRDFWRPRNCVKFDGKWLAGDSDSNRIVEIDVNTYSDSLPDPEASSTVQLMEWTYQPVYAEGQRAFHDRLEVVMDTGVGLTTGQGSDPKIMMEYSDNGGTSWHALPDKDIGKIGKKEVRAVWHNLGSARQRVYRGSISDPVPVTITDTLIEVRGGRL